MEPRIWDHLPVALADSVVAEGAILASPAWHRVLTEAFDCRVRYLVDDTIGDGLAVVLFKAGPFRVGYLGFPMTETLAGDRVTTAWLASIRQAGLCDVIRYHSDAPAPLAGVRRTLTAETIIDRLAEWSFEKLPPAVRRNVRKAGRGGLELGVNRQDIDPTWLHAMYRATVQRHHGALRYNARYFAALARLAAECQSIDLLTAHTATGDRAAFVVIARHRRTAYYLHGAFAPKWAHLRPSDMLFHAAIARARDHGMRSFNMLASPLDQTGLLLFKEKWGGSTRPYANDSLPITPIRGELFRLAESVYRRIGSLLSRVVPN